MSKMNEYPSVGDPQEFTQAEKAAFLGSANIISTGTKGGATVTANIPFTEFAPTVSQTYDATSEAPISGKGVASALANFGGFIVTTIENGKPKVSGIPDQKKIYLTPSTEPDTNDAYDEWICTDATVPTWEKVGVTRVELNQYVQKSTMGRGIFYDISSGGLCVDYESRRGLSVVGNRLAVNFNASTIVMGDDGLEVANPVPTPDDDHADVGKVLTVQQASDPDDPDEIVWAAPQGGLPTYDSTYAGRVLTVNQAGNGVEWTTPQGGGGSSLPAYTSDDDCAVLAVNSTHDGCEWIGFPSLGSAGEHGYSPVLRTRIDYIVPDGHPIEDGEWVNSTTFTNPGLPYKYITGGDSNASNDWAYGKAWTISGNKAIAEIDNEMLCSMEDLDPVYGDSDFENVTEIEIRILIDSPLLPPFATIEFTNKTGNTVTVTCSHGKRVNGTYKKWEQGIDYMYGSPLKLISLCGTTKSNSIPTNTFVQLQLLGTGYRLYTE